MRLKKYIEFIKENKQVGFNSTGEWVESLISDEYIKNIVGRFTRDIDPDIDLASAINLLDKKVQGDIKHQIENYLQNGIESKQPMANVSSVALSGSNIYVNSGDISVEELTEDVLQAQVQPQSQQAEITMAGKGIFTSFLKSLTALGHKMAEANWETCPENFLLYYYYKDLDSKSVQEIFNRFKSLSKYSDKIDYGKNEVSLYFGVKCDGQFEYGVCYDDKLTPIGKFKLSQSAIKWITLLESKSAHSLKKELVNLNYADILLLGKIKTDMKEFNPGYHEKKGIITLKDRIISFGYYGVGVWNQGKLDEGELMKIKNNFTTWCLSKKWGTKVLISVKPESFWLYIHIKLK